MNDAAHDLRAQRFGAHAEEASGEPQASTCSPDSARSGTYRAVRPRVDASNGLPPSDRATIEVRRERLEQIASLVAAGLWRTDADEVAERILSESAA